MSLKRKDKKQHSRIHLMNDNLDKNYEDLEAYEDYITDDFEEYMEDEISKIDREDLEKVLENEAAIADKLQHATPLKKFATIGKVMFSMLRDTATGRYPYIPWLTVATIVLMLLYVLNPLDLIPDFIPFIGYVDDLVVLTVGLGWIETDLHNYLDWRIESLQEEEED